MEQWLLDTCNACMGVQNEFHRQTGRHLGEIVVSVPTEMFVYVWTAASKHWGVPAFAAHLTEFKMHGVAVFRRAS